MRFNSMLATSHTLIVGRLAISLAFVPTDVQLSNSPSLLTFLLTTPAFESPFAFLESEMDPPTLDIDLTFALCRMDSFSNKDFYSFDLPDHKKPLFHPKTHFYIYLDFS